MVKAFLLVLLAVSCVLAAKNPDFNYDQEYEKFVVKFDRNHKNMDHKEIKRRQNKFFENIKKYKVHNNKPGKTFTVGINKFSDRDPNELVAELCGGLPISTARSLPVLASAPFLQLSDSTPPASLDYSSYCTHIRDQGYCRSCWAFSSVGLLECWNKYKNSSWNYELSEQFLLDCQTTRAYGCNGGWPDASLAFIKDNNQGLHPTADSYPYTAVKSTCVSKGLTKVQTNFKSIETLLLSTEETLMNRLWTKGPVIINMEVPKTAEFFGYTEGVFNGDGCSLERCRRINHVVVVVGYGTDAVTGIDYWLIRNSFSDMWGENGYLRLERNKNACGVSCYIIVID